MPLARRSAFAICSGSPATRTGRSGSEGAADLTQAIMASISAIMLSRVESRPGSMTMLSMPLIMQRRHARARGNLAIGADAADVVRVAQAVHRNAMLLRRADRPFDRLTRDRLTIAGMRIPYRDRAGVGDDFRLLVDLERTGLEVSDIGDQHPDAVAVMAAQVCLNQMFGNDGSFRRRTAAGGDDAVCKRAQPGVVDNHVLSLFFLIGSVWLVGSAWRSILAFHGLPGIRRKLPAPGHDDNHGRGHEQHPRTDEPAETAQREEELD